MMTTLTLITPNLATDEQRDQIGQFAEVAARKAVKTLNLGIPGAQRIIARGDELKARIIAAINELSIELADLACFTIPDWNASYRILFTPEQIAAIGALSTEVQKIGQAMYNQGGGQPQEGATQPEEGPKTDEPSTETPPQG